MAGNQSACTDPFHIIGRRDRVAALYRLASLQQTTKPPKPPGIRHSSWAALHAVTEYVDHHRPTRAKNVQDRARLRLASQWFGSGARLKARAWDLALEMAT